jgi:hypothetical protein
VGNKPFAIWSPGALDPGSLGSLELLEQGGVSNLGRRWRLVGTWLDATAGPSQGSPQRDVRVQRLACAVCGWMQLVVRRSIHPPSGSPCQKISDLFLLPLVPPGFLTVSDDGVLGSARLPTSRLMDYAGLAEATGDLC